MPVTHCLGLVRQSLVRHYWPLFALAVLVTAGCAPSATSSPPVTVTPNSATSLPAVQTAEDPRHKDIWQVLMLQGNKAGYEHTTVTPINDEGGRPALRVAALSVVSVSRAQQTIEQHIRLNSVERPTGELLRFTCEMSTGDAPVTTDGEVVADVLKLTTQSSGKISHSQQAWPAGTGGFYALELSLEREPLQPKQTRTLNAFQAAFFQIATVELVAGEYEATPLLDRREELLPVQVTATLPGQQQSAWQIWQNRRGEVLRSHTNALGQQLYRCTQQQALAKSTGNFDLILNSTIKINRPLESPHSAGRIRYQVQLASSDPAKVFVADLSQAVKSLDAHTAEVTVSAIRPDLPSELASQQSPPTDDDRQPNNLIQSDDARVRELARAAAGSETDPWQLACKLEDYVHHKITVKDFSKGFATAAEVAQNPEGDCTEHAVLLAALARANRLPARVAIGLVYVPAAQGFGYHMWNELWINDRWVPMDATLGRGGIGAGHLKLATSSLKGASAYSSFLPVAQVMGQLKISVADVK